ncbi:hypothetical protein GCM10027404_18400 [Arthrobacter tumbae]|uniref:anthrone oxygenase family protein n=1 Tax=Arthrobacter tumbae TaxID=163874 RepID=UPI00195634C8|nr:anthrone oxygenase family protein [Arthrobacter tumbae]MBM7780886.1 putative membrane protein [Arthrobacter tumbae]
MTTPDLFQTVATTTAAVCAGATGGVYVAFSTMVMPALNSRAGSEAIGAMQRINVLAVRPPFMVLFFGGAVASVVAGATSGMSDAQGLLRLTGAALSLASFGVTVVVNVPLNNRLARVSGAADPAAWQSFAQPWARANTLRGLLALAGAAALAGSLTR